MHNQIDLRAMAHQAMIDAGFVADIPPEAIQQAHQTNPAVNQPGMRDMRELLWSSIDNPESLDLDQIEFAEKLRDDTIRILIGIADVDSRVPKGSPLDKYAAANAVSVYAGVTVFPMLPEELSTDLTSLRQDQDRQSVVSELVLSPDGQVHVCEAYSATVRNKAKLDYPSVGNWLAGNAPPPSPIAHSAPLEAQVRLQSEATDRLEKYRNEHGALNLDTNEIRPVTQDGKVVDLESNEDNPARDLIENFMVAANSAMGSWLKSKGFPSIQRIVREPAQWPRIVRIAEALGEQLPQTPDSKALSTFMARQKAADPTHYQDLALSVVKLLGAGEYVVVLPGQPTEEHFGLAVYGYSRSTAPNRRYTDLVTQRLLKAAIAGQPPPYTPDELTAIADHSMERESAARKVERLMRKAAAALFLSNRIGESFTGIITGVSPKGTFVRLLKPPAEGRIVQGEEGMQIGDKVRVRLVHTEPERGFIDFVRG